MLPLLDEFKQKLLKEHKLITMTNTISICFMLEDWYGSDRMEKITCEDLDRFKKYLMTEYITRTGGHYHLSTIVARFEGLKKYFAFLMEKKYISKDPMCGLEFPKTKPQLPPWLPTEKEVRELINKVDASSPQGSSDKAVIALMSIMPLKNKEVGPLTVDQVDIENRCVYPIKGSKELAIPMPDPIFEILNKYITKDRYHIVKWLKAPTDLLFVSRLGTAFFESTLNNIFSRYNRYAPREKRIYPYLMRPATANHMRKRGMKLEDIHKILGVKYRTVGTYTTLARNEIRAEEERYVAKIPLFKEFKEKLVKDELSPNMIHNALKAIIFFAKYLKSDDMKKITPADIGRCKNYVLNEYITIENRKLTEQEVALRLRALKTYFNFLAESRYLSSDPAVDIKIPDVPPRINWYRPTDEAIEEFASRPDPYTYVGMRDAVIIRLWHLTALKPNEHMDLKVQDIDLNKKVLYVPGPRRRTLKLDDKTYKAVERYLTKSRPVFLKKAKEPTDKLFMNEWGGPLALCSMYDIFWKYKGDRKIKPCISRHARALKMFRDGSSAEEVKKALGFRSIRSCQAYKAMVAKDVTGFYKKDRFEEKVRLIRREKPAYHSDNSNLVTLPK